MLLLSSQQSNVLHLYFLTTFSAPPHGLEKALVIWTWHMYWIPLILIFAMP